MKNNKLFIKFIVINYINVCKHTRTDIHMFMYCTICINLTLINYLIKLNNSIVTTYFIQNRFIIFLRQKFYKVLQ